MKYLGFNDLWFTAIGIFILSFVTDYLFANSFSRYPFGEAVINWSVSLFFSCCYWFITRVMIIFLRKKYPAIQQTMKRVMILFFALLVTVLSVDYFGNTLLFFGLGDQYNPIERSRVLLPVLLISMMVIAMYEAVYFYVKLKKSIREEEQTKQIMVKAQLEALRNQAQPHFFFNSLNTLRDIIDQNPKEDAKEFVNRLADVYRFILESNNVNTIALRDELKFSKAYMHIQSERFGENLKVNWNLPESSLNKMVAPMSLQLLLENAIKHNVVSKSKPLSIDVWVEGETLVVENNIQPKSTQLPSTKLGLQNIQKRYELISNVPVNIKNDETRFSVALPLLVSIPQITPNENTDH